MTDLKITTVNDFDQGGVFALRTIRVGDKTARTPTAASLPGKRRNYESVHPGSRGVNELYRTASGAQIDAGRHSTDGGKIEKELKKQFERTGDDELTIAFTKYSESRRLEPAHARYLAEVHAKYSDIVTIPLMPNLVKNIEEGLGDPNYRSFKKSVVTFLNQVDDNHSEKPVMGLIPRLDWEFIDDLMEVYESWGVQAYAFDFNRCKVTTGSQLATVRPLMQSIANRGIEDHVLFYAINPSPGVVDQTMGARPASDIASFGLGFDIVGGRHVSPTMPGEVFEKQEAEEGEEPTFRLFDRETWIYSEVPLGNLTEQFPEESAFDPERIATRVRRSPDNAKYRLQHLVNSEQRALAAADLRAQLEDGQGYRAVTAKSGVTDQTRTAFEQVREEFDGAHLQSGLGEF